MRGSAARRPARKYRTQIDPVYQSDPCCGCSGPSFAVFACLLVILMILLGSWLGSTAGRRIGGYYDYGSPHYLDEPDLEGFEWAPVTDRAVLRCMNLEMVLKIPKLRGGMNFLAPENAAWESEKCQELLVRHHSEAVPLHRSTSGVKCVAIKEQHTIIPGVDWGSADTKTQQRCPPHGHRTGWADRRLAWTEIQLNGGAASRGRWELLNCDCYFDRKCRRGVKPREPDMLKETRAEGIASAVAARKTEERLARAGKDPVVAVCLGATSAKMVFRSLDDCPLFAQLLPSIARTLQPGFECVAPPPLFSCHLREGRGVSD